MPPGVYVTDIADAEIGKTGRHRSDPRLASAMAQMSVLSRPKMWVKFEAQAVIATRPDPAAPPSSRRSGRSNCCVEENRSYRTASRAGPRGTGSPTQVIRPEFSKFPALIEEVGSQIGPLNLVAHLVVRRPFGLQKAVRVNLRNPPSP